MIVHPFRADGRERARLCPVAAEFEPFGQHGQNGDVARAARLGMFGIQDHAAVPDGDVFPEQALHFLRPDARKNHQGRAGNAGSVEFVHACLEQECHFLQRQGGNFLLLQERRVHPQDRVFVAPAAFDGEGKDAAQDQSCLVPLAGGGEGIHQDALAVLHADVPQGRLFQFRIAFLELLDDAPDVRQRAGACGGFWNAGIPPLPSRS